MKVKAFIQSVERDQYNNLSVRLANGGRTFTLTLDKTQVSQRAYTVGREVEITVKPK